MQEGGKKAIIAAFLANLGIALIKFLAFIATGASSLLAEGLHSLADTGNQLLLFLGTKKSKKNPTPEHQFGYGSERYFWSFVVALVLFSLGGLFSLFEGIEKLRNPHELENLHWGFIVLTIAFVLEFFSLRVAIKETNKVRGRLSIWKFILKSKQPELPTVLLEDTGALTGLVFALVGLSLSAITGNPKFDAIATICIGLLLIVIAYILVKEMKSLLIGEAVDLGVAEQIKKAVLDGDETKDIIHMKTLHNGPDDILLCIKVELLSTTVGELAKDINAVEKRVREVVPGNLLIYIEPDIKQ